MASMSQDKSARAKRSWMISMSAETGDLVRLTVVASVLAAVESVREKH
jgi:hypothetical protein